MTTFELRAIGTVVSGLTDCENAPRQPDEGAPDAWLVFEPSVRDALGNLRPGDPILVLTWLHLASRDTLVVHPRGDSSRPPEGVFSTRSPDRPNPIGLHEVVIIEIDRLRVRVDRLEAVNGTPILDIKPVIGEIGGR